MQEIIAVNTEAIMTSFMVYESCQLMGGSCGRGKSPCNLYKSPIVTVCRRKMYSMAVPTTMAINGDGTKVIKYGKSIITA